MSYTKRDVVLGAFEELGLASYPFNLTPEELNSGLRRLDAMMANWDAQTVSLGYTLPATPEDSDLDEACGTPDFARLAMTLQLAIQLAPQFGKQLSPQTMMNAKNAYMSMITMRQTPQQQLPANLPTGAGNQRWGIYPRFFRPAENVTQQDGPELF